MILWLFSTNSMDSNIATKRIVPYVILIYTVVSSSPKRCCGGRDGRGTELASVVYPVSSEEFFA